MSRSSPQQRIGDAQVAPWYHTAPRHDLWRKVKRIILDFLAAVKPQPAPGVPAKQHGFTEEELDCIIHYDIQTAWGGRRGILKSVSPGMGGVCVPRRPVGAGYASGRCEP